MNFLMVTLISLICCYDKVLFIHMITWIPEKDLIKIDYLKKTVFTVV